MTDDQITETAARALASAASSPAQVYLFGSRARGEHAADSNFDFLVVEERVDDRFAEAAILNRVVGRLGIPADVLVAEREQFERWYIDNDAPMHSLTREARLVAEGLTDT